jgi:lipoprotein-anchoring transpeptidase ErfK/SrfK
MRFAREEAMQAGREPFAVVVRAPVSLRPRFWLVAFLLLGIGGVAATGTGYGYGPPKRPSLAVPADLPQDEPALKRSLRDLKAQQARHRRTLASKAPRGLYLVVDQTQNRLYIMRDEQVLHTAVCSAGSGMILREGEGGRKWVFDTPRGLFRVRHKVENPVWRKPDWAFIEEGLPIPKDPGDRFEYGTLGEYALYLGDGYLIHGTLYERLLGRSVTHGCIRLGRDDLRKVWKAAPVGTPVYIY